MVESPSLQVPKSHQSLMLQEPWFIPLRPNPSKEIIVETFEERGLSHPRQDFSRRVLLATLRRRIQCQRYCCILLWLIIDKRLLVMVPLLLMIMMMIYVFYDWHIVAYTGFHAAFVLFLACAGVRSWRSWGLWSARAKEWECYLLYERQRWIPGKPSSLVGLSAIRNLHYSVKYCC